MKEKKILYDHNLDKKNQNKWQTDVQLKKINSKYLPNYIKNNIHDYLEWIEE